MTSPVPRPSFWSTSIGSRRQPPPDDRRVGGAGRLLPLFAATSASVGLAAQSVPTRQEAAIPGLLVGVLVAAMAIFLLTSIPARWASRGVVLVGAVLMVRYGEMSGGPTGTDSLQTLLWGGASAAAFVLGSRLGDVVVERAPSSARRSAAAGRAGPLARTVQLVVVVGALVSASALAFGPSLAGSIAPASADGDRADPRDAPSNPLRATDELDMTQRPRLSDRTVMHVEAARPSFWRTSTFDLWSGRSWARLDRQLELVEATGGAIDVDDADLAARDGQTFEQRIRLESRYVELLPTAPSAISIDSPVAVAQWPDGSLVPAFGPLGSGATYTVTSRQVPITEALLQSADAAATPPDVRGRYAGDTVATDRVRALAAELSAGAATTYEKVRATEAWMGAHTRYSQDAPLAPTDADVVDDFLFESKLGWCEQIASSLTVLLRLQGVPARLATGFVPGEWDAITRTFEVRERDAHAWTEVWFAGLGWVPFDPTAEVPLSGEQTDPSTLVGFWWAHATWLLLAVAIVAGATGPFVRLVAAIARRVVRRRSRRIAPAGRGLPWVADLERRLERIGDRHGRARGPDETATAYAGALAELPAFVGTEVAAVGVALDAASYGSGPADETSSARVWCEAAVATLEATPVGRPEPVGVS